MLAGIEEPVHSRKRLAVTAVKTATMTAIDAILEGLIDYAGLYPPASLNMRSAVENYRRYRREKNSNALGRFIVDLNKTDELRAAAGNLRDFKLTIILGQPADAERLARLLEDGMPIESIEFKAAIPEHIEQISRLVGPSVETYVEVPIESMGPDLVQSISAIGGRVKLRTGGVVPAAIPSPLAIARALESILRAGLSFKATAGLHHPFRSYRRLTYAHDSPSAAMHGFINLIVAVALLLSGANAAEAESVLSDEDPASWGLTPEALSWRDHRWSAAQLMETRRTFLSFGSCSFEEPMRDLEALAWV
jgi:hypothetical protein